MSPAQQCQYRRALRRVRRQLAAEAWAARTPEAWAALHEAARDEHEVPLAWAAAKVSGRWRVKR